MEHSSEHFDKIAGEYDYWKKKNWYYYQNLKQLVAEHVALNSNVLELGCGTGNILASLRIKEGVGIDTSRKMVELARRKFQNIQNLHFHTLDSYNIDIAFDFIILVDVIEHVGNLTQIIEQITRFCNTETVIFISMANPKWEPILLLLERLKLKMPEGNHYRFPAGTIIKEFAFKGFELVEHDFRLLLPYFIPILSDVVNALFFKVKILKFLGVTEYFIFKFK